MFTALPKGNAPRAANTAGQRHRDRMARKSRENNSRVTEIGLPPERDQERWERYRFNLFGYLCECFPETTGLSPLSLAHKRLAERTQQCLINGGLDLFIVYRGFAKSTITENAATWAAGYGHRKFFVPVGATDEMAEAALDSIQYEFETNDHLMALFPEACHAARALEGIAQRAGKQTINGHRTYICWNNKRCILPTVEGFDGSGAIIWPKGITSNIRGLRFKRPDGSQARPDFIMGDDLQTDQSAASPAQCGRVLSSLTKTILRLGGHRKKIAVTVNATIIQPDDAVDQLSDAKKFPAWRTMKVPMLQSFSNAHETLWLGRYAEIRTTFSHEDENDKDRAEREANEFYLANREEMDAGAEATWESCFDQENEISAIQHAYNILIDTGEDAFMAECQNKPARDVSGLVILTPDQMCLQQSDYDEGHFPADCRDLTFHCDVHPGILYWQVWAWDQHFTGYLIEYGTFPKQTRPYFAHRSISKRLKHFFPGLDPGATIARGLDAFLHGTDELGWPGMMNREWERSDGVRMKVRCGGVDANGEHRDEIVTVLSNSPFAASLHPSFGKGIGAKSAPMAAWEQTRSQGDVGPEWVYTQPKPGEIQGVMHETNYWRTRFHRALALPKGAKSKLYVYRVKNANDHRMLADHWNAETPKEVSHLSRVVQEFKQKPNTDNHHFDTSIGAMVAASRCRISNFDKPRRKPRRPKRKVTYYD